MSTFRVEVTSIDEVLPHPNADRLDLVRIKDWMCVTGKGNFKAGDAVVYFPIDSVLPGDLECKLFPPGSKITLTKSRIRTIKIRKAVSQGLVVRPSELGITAKLGTDVAAQLGVTKYEPPVRSIPQNQQGKAVSKKQVHPDFRKYCDIENAKNYPTVFTDGEMVSITEKLHGSSFRCGYVPYHAGTLWKKVKKFFGFAPSHEFVYGSRNVQLQNKLFYKGYYDKNIYAEMVMKYNLDAKLKPGECVYGEIVGDGIQKNYTYGCKSGERKLVIYDVMVDGKYLDVDQFKTWCDEHNLERVPELYYGPYSKEKVIELTNGDSIYAPDQKIREGVVVKPLKDELCFMGRKLLKFISDAYLLRDDNTDFH